MNSRGPLTLTGIYQIMARRSRQCGVTAYPHRFRHHFSHTWLDRGGAERDLMELNGWTSPQMLSRYGASARGRLMAYMTLPWAPVATLINSLPLAGSGPSQRLQNRCSARPGCGIMEAQARAGPGQAGRPLRRLADCKVTCRGIR
jgi:hypothetical protein